MREAYTQIAAGLRRLTPAHVLAEATAERYDGRPEDATKGQILAAFKRAAGNLGIPPRLRDATDILMSWSQEQDWDADSRPIVWPSNRLLQEELGLSLRQVQYTIRALVEANLVVPVDSPTGRRFGRRHPASHKIVEAYGFDLSPLAVRYQEFLEIAERAREDRQFCTQLRKRLTIARKGIQQIAQTGIDYGLPGEDWATWARQAIRSVQLLADEASLTSLSVAVESLERQREAGEEILNNAFLSKDPAPSNEADCTLITTTTKPSADKSASCKAAQQGERSGGRRASSASNGISRETSELEAMKITPNFVLSVCPSLQAYVAAERPGWADIVEAADWVRGELGISRPAWIEACEVMGRYEAAGAVAVIAAKGGEIRSPGGYLRGMTDRARDGELHLGKSFYGLLDKSGARGGGSPSRERPSS